MVLVSLAALNAGVCVGGRARGTGAPVWGQHGTGVA
jgi:hypothetical protein